MTTINNHTECDYFPHENSNNLAIKVTRESVIET